MNGIPNIAGWRGSKSIKSGKKSKQFVIIHYRMIGTIGSGSSRILSVLYYIEFSKS